jgi:GGDEF domain-containing protein
MERAVQIAEKIRADIEASSVDIEGENVSFTVSIGVASILEHSPVVEEIIDNARSAMRAVVALGVEKAFARFGSVLWRTALAFEQLRRPIGQLVEP